MSGGALGYKGNGEKLTVSECTFKNNTAVDGSGGAFAQIFNDRERAVQNVTVQNCEFEANKAGRLCME